MNIDFKPTIEVWTIQATRSASFHQAGVFPQDTMPGLSPTVLTVRMQALFHLSDIPSLLE